MRVGEGASNVLNLSRWIAAVLVMASHIRQIVFIDYHELATAGFFLKAFYLLTSLGHEMVVIFFVISGFLVGGLSLARMAPGRFAPAPFFISRFARIYTVLIPALLAGAAFDLIGSHLFFDAHLYDDPARYHAASLACAITESLNLPTFFGNLLMLQGSTVATFGSNGPLWSLANEWWYYCLFALAATGFSTRSRGLRAVCAVLGLSLTMLLPAMILLWASVWCLGLVSGLYASSRFRKPRPLTGLLLFFAALVASRLTHGAEAGTNSGLLDLSRDLMLGLAYSVFLASILAHPVETFLPRFNKALSDMSFSLYLSHFPALIFIVALCHHVFGQAFRLQPSAAAFSYAAVIAVILTLYAAGFYALTEARTGEVRRWLSLSKGRSAVSVAAE